MEFSEEMESGARDTGGSFLPPRSTVTLPRHSLFALCIDLRYCDTVCKIVT